ncbi:MAG TPA: type II CRISPR-associated endonuclease Cas1 [Bacteroidales bacterium]|nr:type II CRISPR-associated endonuclease Cas1 [Bacteroidales bacterium]
MIKRTLFFTTPARLSLKDNQLVFQGSDAGEIRTMPIEDLGFVVLENHQISVSLPLLDALSVYNVGVVICDKKHLPTSMLLNLDSHNIQTELFSQQMNATEPLKKNLWKQTVEAKIANQAALLAFCEKKHSELIAYQKDVKSGDTTNREGAAARIYWKRLFGNEFERDRYGIPPNNMLNYGYIILRAAVARALSGSGLLPTLGIHHHNRYNSFCLADDIMEPYRPYIDKLVFELHKSNPNIADLTAEVKLTILEVLSADVLIDKIKRPLMVAISMTTASLSRCFTGESKKILYPALQSTGYC